MALRAPPARRTSCTRSDRHARSSAPPKKGRKTCLGALAGVTEELEERSSRTPTSQEVSRKTSRTKAAKRGAPALAASEEAAAGVPTETLPKSASNGFGTARWDASAG